MNVKFDSITKDLKEAIKTPTEKTKPYDTTAEVLRIEGDTVWVHIAGGVEETPVKKTIDARKGDTVQVRVSGGNAWITGNATAPPTDDYEAKKAQKIANESKGIADFTSQYFWFTPTGNDTGAHITEIPQKDFLNNPIYGGGNLLARSNGVAVRDGLTELAIFSANEARIGKFNEEHIQVTPTQINVIGNDGAQIAYFGQNSRFGRATDSYVDVTPYHVELVRSTDGTLANRVSIASFGESIRVGKVNSGHTIIDGNGMEVFNGATSLAFFGATARVGQSGVGYVNIQSTGIDMYAGSSNVNLAHIGYDTGQAQSGTAVAPYYTFGTRASGSAVGNYSTAIGIDNTASGYCSISIGAENTASYIYAYAEGRGNTASGAESHAEGFSTMASGDYSHAENALTTASGKYSHANGEHTIAQGYAQTVIGRNNIAQGSNSSLSSTDYAFIIGNGASPSSRSNAFAVDWEGYIYRGNMQVPIIVETGTSGNWAYKKWSDGTIDAWYYGSKSLAHYTTANGFYAYGYNAINLPFTMANNNYQCDVDFLIGSGFSFGASVRKTTTQLTNLFALATASGTQTVYLNAHIHGTLA